MQGPQGNYASPHVADYGDLRTITEAFNPVVGATDLGFSAPNSPPTNGGTDFGPRGPSQGDPASVGGSQIVDAIPTPNSGGPGGQEVGGVADGGGSADPIGGDGGSGGGGSGGGGSGSGSGGGGGGGSGDGGSLPFTGLPAAVVAGAGSALAATGAAVRRFTRRRA
jgi:hypothetical protein